MKIDEIEDPQIRALAWKYRKANNKEEFNEDTVFRGFDWEETREGRIFWSDVYCEYEVEITEKMKQEHPEIFLKQEEEMKNEFNFKVGDKVTTPNIHFYITVTAIGETSFLGIDSRSGLEEKGYKSDNWQLYQPKPEKVKLTKFYCSAFDDKFYDDEFIIIFLSSKERAKDLGYKHVYTEKEFLEKFDVIL